MSELKPKRIKLPGGYYVEDSCIWHKNGFSATIWGKLPNDEAIEAFAAALNRRAPERHNELREALVKVYAIYCSKVKAEYRKLKKRKGAMFKPEEARYLDFIGEVGKVCESALAEQAAPVKEK